MNDLSNEERETHFNMTGDDHGVWLVYSDDPFWIRRLDAIAEFVRNVGHGKEYRLQADQLTLRKGKRQLSAEHKAQLADRMRSLRQTTSSAVAKQAN